MILLDTNVLAALMHDPPDPAVIRWLDRQPAAQVWTTSISVFETRFGLARLPESRRRRRLEGAFDALLRADLTGRIAMLDREAAEAAADLAARRAALGRGTDVRDTLIAGIALAQRATIATRNIRHFDDLEFGVVDPWAALT